MIVYNSLLPLKEGVNKNQICELVIRWNKNSPHVENRISDLEWDGNFNIKYGSDSLYLIFEEYRNENVLAIRFQKKNEIIWTTDIIANFNERKIAIVLDRSVSDDYFSESNEYYVPYIVKMLIDAGYIGEDKNIPILQSYLEVDENNLNMISSIINKKIQYSLPIIYVTKLRNNENPIDLKYLCKRLIGLAHIFVEKETSVSQKLQYMCGMKNEYLGAVGIYYPSDKKAHIKFRYFADSGFDYHQVEAVVNSVTQFSNLRKFVDLYTWQGVQNRLLSDRLSSNKKERLQAINEAKKAKNDVNEYVELYENEIKEMKDKVEGLINENRKLKNEINIFRNQIPTGSEVPLLFYGKEKPFFSDEIKSLIISTLSKSYNSSVNGRKNDVIKDIVEANSCQFNPELIKNELKNKLRGYKNLSDRERRFLNDIGFEINDEGKHYKLKYFGDNRYTVIIAKTPSDNRTGNNSAIKIINTIF